MNIDVIVMTIEDMPTEDIASAYLGLTGFGYVNKSNGSYKTLLGKGLITENGFSTFDLPLMLEALEFEINKRNMAATQGNNKELINQLSLNDPVIYRLYTMYRIGQISSFEDALVGMVHHLSIQNKILVRQIFEFAEQGLSGFKK